MGLFDSLLGRTKPPKANLDVLFSVPQAALTLRTADFTFSRSGAVCYKAGEGAAFDETEDNIEDLLRVDGDNKLLRTEDKFGFTWLALSGAETDASSLVANLHSINSSLVDEGFGTSLLCSTINFRTNDDQPLCLVYLFKQGTFYPFAPIGGNKRDNALELRVRGMIDEDIPMESELGKWLAIWGAPGL